MLDKKREILQGYLGNVYKYTQVIICKIPLLCLFIPRLNGGQLTQLDMHGQCRRYISGPNVYLSFATYCISRRQTKNIKNKIEVLNRSFNDTNSGKLKRQSRRNASLSSADVAARVRSSTQAGTREPRKASCADFKYRGPTM